MEKLALFLIIASRKMRSYFQAHRTHVLNNFILKQVFQKPNASRRLMKWTVKLSEFDIVFKARTFIKYQALADFVVEFVNVLEMEERMEPAEPSHVELICRRLRNRRGFGQSRRLQT